MKNNLLLTCVVMFAFVVNAFAQERTVTGTITDGNDGLPLPGVNVIIKGSTKGTNTDINGSYSINVPADNAVLIYSFVGYVDQEISVGNRSTINVTLAPNVEVLSEIVVTGVAAGTDTKKLGFTVAKVNQDLLEEVPALDAGNAIRGKLAGARVVQPSGDPASTPEIRLRGSKSVNRSQSPLYIMDGIYLNPNGGASPIQGISQTDARAIEVVKGAAASALYGSQAGGGVVQILSKRGGSRDGRPTVQFKAETGFSEIVNSYPLADQTPFQQDPNAAPEAFGHVLAADGTRVLNEDGKYVDHVAPIFDNEQSVLTSKPFTNLHFNIGGGNETLSYFASLTRLTQDGAVEPLNGYTRNNVRLNLDYQESIFNVSFSSLIATESGDDVQDGNRGGQNVFFQVLQTPRFINLSAKDDNGQFRSNPPGNSLTGNGGTNPLYFAEQLDFGFERKRILAGVNASVEPMKGLKLGFEYSFDFSDFKLENFTPKNFLDPRPGSAVGGAFTRVNAQNDYQVVSAYAAYNKTFGDLEFGATAKYLFERSTGTSINGGVQRFAVSKVRSLNNYSRDSDNLSNVNVGSGEFKILSENIYLNTILGYKEKLYLDALVRRDISSLFGAENRSNIYYRGSLNYIISEDFKIKNVQLLKARASYGVSGQRPGFDYQYDVASQNGENFLPQQTGNPNLKPSEIGELEVGLDVTFLNRFRFAATYADARVKDDFLIVPLDPAEFRNPTRWENAASIKSTALEFQLGAAVIEKGDLTWDVNLTWDKITQEITDIGDVNPFTRNLNPTPIYRVEAGLPYGTIYGQRFITSLDELQITEGRLVNTAGLASVEGVDFNNVTRDDFVINSDGYVVVKGSENTAAERPVLQYNEDGELASVAIGNSNPNWNVGFTSNLRWKGIGFYMVWDWQNGGDIYNYSRQLLFFEYLHKEQQEYSDAGKHVNYSASGLYNGANPVSHFVEKGSFAKLREMTVSYTLPGSKMGSLGKVFRSARFGLTGRNLLTITDYTGYDPEVALNGNPTNFRVDAYAYPQTRSYTASITLNL